MRAFGPSAATGLVLLETRETCFLAPSHRQRHRVPGLLASFLHPLEPAADGVLLPSPHTNLF